MTTARHELPYPCSPKAKTLGGGKPPLVNTLAQRTGGICSASNMQIRNMILCEASKF